MADNNYRLGDVEINNLVIVSQRGSIDLRSSLVSLSIYESVFTPGMVCDITVLDMNDMLGQARLIGDETVQLELYVKGSQTAPYTFAVHDLSELENVGAQKGKMYTLKCVSEEAMYAKTNFVQKSYNQLCSEMIEDIHYNYLRSSKPIEIETTRAPQKMVIPNRNPFEAINLIKKRSVSMDQRSSFYVFFENRRNEQQTYNFVTLEKLFSEAPVKDFQMSDAINTSIRARGDDNILAFKIPNQFSSTDRIAYGGPRRITTFNFTTWQFETKNVETSESSFTGVGGAGTMESSAFANKYFTSDSPPQSLIPIDISQRPETFIPESTPDTQALIALLMQNSLKIKVIGDTVLTAGVTINCTLPNRRSFTGSAAEDPLITGKVLITRIHHRIGTATDRPRYTCTIEGIKGRYEEAL
jgi:hypothetical protein